MHQQDYYFFHLNSSHELLGQLEIDDLNKILLYGTHVSHNTQNLGIKHAYLMINKNWKK
jgi:hypothetical protein